MSRRFGHARCAAGGAVLGLMQRPTRWMVWLALASVLVVSLACENGLGGPVTGTPTPTQVPATEPPLAATSTPTQVPATESPVAATSTPNQVPATEPPVAATSTPNQVPATGPPLAATSTPTQVPVTESPLSGHVHAVDCRVQFRTGIFWSRFTRPPTGLTGLTTATG